MIVSEGKKVTEVVFGKKKKKKSLLHSKDF